MLLKPISALDRKQVRGYEANYEDSVEQFSKIDI